MPHRFLTLDVFTDTALAGNPLAVVFEADDLDDAAMQAIAAEFNLSETVFITEPKGREADWGLRIFTPQSELPFAGHPTVGAAIALGLERSTETGKRLRFVLEEIVGDITADVRINSQDHASARFFLPRLPERTGDLPDLAGIATALGLQPGDLLDTPVQGGIWSAGVPIAIVPLKYPELLADITLDIAALRDTFGDCQAYVVAKASSSEFTHDWRVRMFAPHLGITEDPATGGAAAAFAGLIAEQAGLGDGEHAISIYQGIEMARPSHLRLILRIENGELTDAVLGGDGVVVSEGKLRI